MVIVDRGCGQHQVLENRPQIKTPTLKWAILR
jgi:hypothetical protein